MTVLRRGLWVVVLVGLTAVAAGTAVAGEGRTHPPRPAAAPLGHPPDPAVSATDAAPSPSASPSASSSASPPVPEPAANVAAIPQIGHGTLSYAADPAPIRGGAGAIHRYRVAVEDDIDQDPGRFAAAVDTILGDPRGWTAGNQTRFQRVGAGEPADFSIVLASPRTSESMCATGGLHTYGYASCHLTGTVVINLVRWLSAVEDFAGQISEYRNYVINHEVGHELGYGHESCPGPGRMAPVMQQQTYGLKGCVANGWPYPAGVRYAGPPAR